MVTIVDCCEFEKILDQTNLHEFELVDLPEQRDTSEALFGCCFGSCRGYKQLVGNCAWELTHARGLLHLFPT